MQEGNLSTRVVIPAGKGGTASALTVSDVEASQEEPRILDLRIAERLGVAARNHPGPCSISSRILAQTI